MIFALFVILLIIVLLIVFVSSKKKKQTKEPDNSVNLNLSEILIFDTETTGIFPKSDEILELAIINGCGDVLFNERFKPEHKTSWPEAEAINGIAPESVKDCKPFSFYKSQLQTIFDTPKIIAGYNVGFDMRFIHAAGIKTHSDYLIDVMKDFADFRGIYDDEHKHNKWFKLNEAAKYYNYQFEPHNALEDTKATLFVFKKLQNID